MRLVNVAQSIKQNINLEGYMYGYVLRGFIMGVFLRSWASGEEQTIGCSRETVCSDKFF